MIACDDTPVRCENQSTEGTLSVSPVFWFRIRTYYAARQVFAMFNRRFDSRPPAERFSVCYVFISHKHSAAPTVAAAQTSAYSSSSQALRIPIPINSTRFATPSPAAAVFGASFSGNAALSFVSLRAAHTSSASSHSRTTLPISSLFAQPAFTVTISPTPTAVKNSALTAVSSVFAPSSMSAAASIVTLASSSTSSTAPTATSATPVTIDPSTQTSSTAVVSKVSTSTRATSRRSNAETHTRRTQPKRAARKEWTVEQPIVLDSSGETHATSSTTANTAAPTVTATTAVSSMPNLLTAAEDESMRVRAARVAKYSYAGSLSPTAPSNPMRFSNLPTAADNFEAPSSKFEASTRALTQLAVGNFAVTRVCE